MEGKVRRVKGKKFKNINLGEEGRGGNAVLYILIFFLILVLPLIQFSSSDALWAWMILTKGYWNQVAALSPRQGFNTIWGGFHVLLEETRRVHVLG